MTMAEWPGNANEGLRRRQHCDTNESGDGLCSPSPNIVRSFFRKYICLLPLPTGHLSSLDTTAQHPYPPACDTVGTRNDDARRARRPTTGPHHKEREHQASTSRSTREWRNRRAYKVLPPNFIIFSYILLMFLFNSRTSQHKGAENGKIHPCGVYFSVFNAFAY